LKIFSADIVAIQKNRVKHLAVNVCNVGSTFPQRDPR
jgi:hypothetical protein